MSMRIAGIGLDWCYGVLGFAVVAIVLDRRVFGLYKGKQCRSNNQCCFCMYRDRMGRFMSYPRSRLLFAQVVRWTGLEVLQSLDVGRSGHRPVYASPRRRAQGYNRVGWKASLSAAVVETGLILGTVNWRVMLCSSRRGL